ncbi:hypothetical protein ACP4OV_006192 [Aristida adscensionis]
MKHLLVPLLVLLAVSLPCIAGDATEPVYDMEGHEVSGDGLYYIVPADGGTNGSGSLGSSSDATEYCSFYVFATVSAGLPVRFTPQNASADGGGAVVRLSSNITIQFKGIVMCLESMEWHVRDSPSPSSYGQRVAVGRKIAQPPMPSVFRVEKLDDATEGNMYKLVYCAGEGPCEDLGLQPSEGMKTWWLVTSDWPLAVVFRKA